MPPSNVSVATSTGGIPRPHPQTPFNPSADQATFRDLLLFEERLKMNAEMLRKRRRRYSGESPFYERSLRDDGADVTAFLWIFIGLLIIMAYRLMFIRPSVGYQTSKDDIGAD
jgi:hypothetical protein